MNRCTMRERLTASIAASGLLAILTPGCVAAPASVRAAPEAASVEDLDRKHLDRDAAEPSAEGAARDAIVHGSPGDGGDPDLGHPAHATSTGPQTQRSTDSAPLVICPPDHDEEAPLQHADAGARTGDADPPDDPDPPGQTIPIDHWQGSVAAPFFAALDRAARGEGKARIVVYGASHVASDIFTGYLRRALQERFGEAGPGFVLPAKPWRFYRNEMVSFDRNRHWQPLRVRARGETLDRYGLAGVALETDGKRAASAAIENRRAGALTGHVSHYELYYARQPGGGRVAVWIDGKHARTIDTAAEQWQAGYAEFEVEDGPHRFELRTAARGRPVRVYGVALERREPGVLVDTLGINGARVRYHLAWDDALYREHLARRRPDLVVLAYGTNEAGDDQPIERYEAQLRQVLQRVRETVPQAACLLIGPSDRPLRRADGCLEDRPRTAALVDVQRRVAREQQCGFFDLVAFMGGPLSMARWVRHEPPFAAPDHVHLTLRGYHRLGEALLEALLHGHESAPFNAPGTVAPDDHRSP